MKLYITLCYFIKHSNIDFLCHAIKKITIILQAPLIKKPKYARAMIRQLHIFDTKRSNSQL